MPLHDGTGKDQLTGGSGSDLFHYGDTDHGGDTVTDFSHADDAFGFDFEQFGQTGTGTLAADHFFTNASDVNVNDACFIFHDASLYYDADGTGSETAIHIADVTGDAVQADDISFV
ncbi:hypothetical protein [uncultured Pseudodesulfovibrio sp.]|jgi:Ca2+-binding RTX toxin-like protein|uniref:hypothetical protein n=1 Tax=uncultured Pseudodesulfovibrio sp. TaxID=2035858 RepID=UPI0029C7D0C9|nr:hypothetical protein [uncultured Pseudodesulfovibrio sp.]